MPSHLENQFREWINELKGIIGHSVERYVFEKTEYGLKPTPARHKMEIHIFYDGGGNSFEVVAFLRQKGGSEYKMKRTHASFKVAFPNSKLYVQRRKVC